MGIGERKCYACAYCGLEFLFPRWSVTFSPLKSFSERFTQVPSADDIDRQGQNHDKEGHFRPLTSKNLSDGTVYHPVRPDEGVAHLKAVLGEFPRPIIKLASYSIERFLWRFMDPLFAE